MARNGSKEQAGTIRRIGVRMTLESEALGTTPANEDVYRDFIASKALDGVDIEAQVAAIGADEVAERGKTVFPRDAAGCPILWDYQLKGFFKEACSMMRKVAGTESSKITAFKKEVDGLIFPVGYDDEHPEQIPFDLHGLQTGELQRPLRASTPQGERVSMACSETVPAGSTLDLVVIYFETASAKYSLGDAIREWLDYGRFKGILQWRNGGKGRFSWEEVDLDSGEVVERDGRWAYSANA